MIDIRVIGRAIATRWIFATAVGLATLADMMVPLSVCATGGGLESRFLLTVHLDIDYLAAVPLGAGVEGRARLLHRTARMVFADGTLKVGGEPVLRASGVFRIRPQTWPLAIG